MREEDKFDDTMQGVVAKSSALGPSTAESTGDMEKADET